MRLVWPAGNIVELVLASLLLYLYGFDDQTNARDIVSWVLLTTHSLIQVSLDQLFSVSVTDCRSLKPLRIYSAGSFLSILLDCAGCFAVVSLEDVRHH